MPQTRKLEPAPQSAVRCASLACSDRTHQRFRVSRGTYAAPATLAG